MIIPTGLKEAIAHLSPHGELAWLLKDDEWRLRNGYFGALSWPLQDSADGSPPLSVYLGGRSGLEVVAAHLRAPAAEILVVEPDAARRRALRRALAPLGAGTVRVCANIDQAREIVAERPITFLRLERNAFPPAAAMALIDGRRCGHLCGAYWADAEDPLALYRASRDRLARSFFWRNDHSFAAFGGDGGPVEIEVSVVVPCYNIEDKVDQCMASLVEQTIEKLEVIAVDDGSLDATGRMLEGWAERYPGRVRVIHKPNGGCASARNVGLAAARGEFFGSVDGDDWVDRSMYQDLYRAAVLRGAEIAQCGYIEVYPDGRHLVYENAFGGDGPDGRTGVVADLTDYLVVRPTIWRRIYRLDFVRERGLIFGDQFRQYDDMTFQFEALSQARRMAVIPDPYYFYRQHAGQSIAADDRRLFVFFEIFDWLRARVMSWADGRIERNLVQVKLNTHFWVLKKLRPDLRKEYLRRMWRQLMDDRVHLTRAEILWLAARQGVHALLHPIENPSTGALPTAGLAQDAAQPLGAPALEGGVASSGGKPSV